MTQSLSDFNERTFVAPERARHVNHTPADLGGVTSFLYELDASYERSFVGRVHSEQGRVHFEQFPKCDKNKEKFFYKIGRKKPYSRIEDWY